MCILYNMYQLHPETIQHYTIVDEFLDCHCLEILLLSPSSCLWFLNFRIGTYENGFLFGSIYPDRDNYIEGTVCR
jgi:hypothetical protein